MYEERKTELKKEIYKITEDHFKTAKIWEFIKQNINIIWDTINHGK